MQIEIKKIEGLCNVYVVKYNKKAIIIDAAVDVKMLAEAVGDAEVVGVILTHGHYDHIMALLEIINFFGVKCYLHKDAIEKLYSAGLNCSIFFGTEFVSDVQKDQLVALKEGALKLHDFLVNVVFTPGHTSCSISLETGGVVFTGDTLFDGGVGRTDLPTSSREELKRSLSKLTKLYEGHKFLPGHGDGNIIR